MTFLRREPPDAFAYAGAKPTRIDFWWRYLCPACCEATVALIPCGSGGWRIASEIGCSRGCTPTDIDAWQAWRCGEAIAPPEPPDDRARRYAFGAVRRILAELPNEATHAQLLHAAFRCGQFIAAGGLDPEPVIAALTSAAGELNLEPIAKALATGLARPARMPS